MEDEDRIVFANMARSFLGIPASEGSDTWILRMAFQQAFGKPVCDKMDELSKASSLISEAGEAMTKANTEFLEAIENLSKVVKGLGDIGTSLEPY